MKDFVIWTRPDAADEAAKVRKSLLLDVIKTSDDERIKLVDARYEYVRIADQVVSQGVRADGKREILAVDVADSEGDATYDACYALPEQHRRRVRSTNALERFNQELKRRTRMMRIFPNADACLQLVSALSMEQSDEWLSGRRYLDMSLLEPHTAAEDASPEDDEEITSMAA